MPAEHAVAVNADPVRGPRRILTSIVLGLNISSALLLDSGRADWRPCSFKMFTPQTKSLEDRRHPRRRGRCMSEVEMVGGEMKKIRAPLVKKDTTARR